MITIDPIARALVAADSEAVADFVALSTNPLDDIRNVRRVEFVVANGRRYVPAELRK